MMKFGEQLEYQARTWDISHVIELRETTAIEPAINLQLLIKKKKTPKHSTLEDQSVNVKTKQD